LYQEIAGQEIGAEKKNSYRDRLDGPLSFTLPECPRNKSFRVPEVNPALANGRL
jgi:hypothetical protein